MPKKRIIKAVNNNSLNESASEVERSEQKYWVWIILEVLVWVHVSGNICGTGYF